MFPGVISIKICPSSWSLSQSPRHLHLSYKRAQRDQRCYKRDVLVLDCSKSLTRKDLSEDHNQRQWCHILIVILGLSLAYMQMIHSGNNQVAWSCFRVPVPVPFHIHFGSSHCWPLDVPSHVFSALLSPVLSVVFNINRDLLLLILIPPHVSFHPGGHMNGHFSWFTFLSFLLPPPVSKQTRQNLHA